ncbi:uncharacterized protein LOC143547094 [Bidens hawaiensis]|uniref:uncharacterized protein LOC143547094 n=1 Tax=Bidens hawaiensis TaxID=980011 RepID=UPI00404B1048
MDQLGVSTSSNATLHQELDSIMGTTTRVPHLLTSDEFDEWKFRFEKYVKAKDVKMWRSIIRGPQVITYQREGSEEIEIKPVELYTNADFDLVEEDEKALATLTMELSPEIALGFRELNSAKGHWEALIEVFEGNEDMRRNRQDLLRQQFNMFNHVLGECLEKQLHWFISLITEIRSANINLTSAEISNKLVNSLLQSWDLNVAVIKKTKDLSKLTLSEVMAIIKACDMDDKQHAINHDSTYNTVGYGTLANNALVSQENFSLFKSQLPQPQQP